MVCLRMSFSLARLRGSFVAQQLERVIPLVVIEAGKTPEHAQRLNPSKNSDFHRRLLHTSGAILARDFPGGKRRLPPRAALSCARCAARKTGKSADCKECSPPAAAPAAKRTHYGRGPD